MEFTVSKSELLRELTFSQGVVEKKTTIPILGNLLIEAHADQVVITATDLELGIQCTFAAQVQQPGSGTIPAKRFLDYVRLLPDEDIRIKFLENHWASITCGRSRTRLAGMSKDSYPELPATPDNSIDLPAATLHDMISQTMFAISAEESRFTLNGALMVLEPTGITMVATDGHRLAHIVAGATLDSITEPQKALLPRKAMAELLKLTDSMPEGTAVGFAFDDNHLFFRLGTRLLITRKLTGSFPDYLRVLPKEHKYEVDLPKDDIRSALERVAQFSDERSRAVKLKFADNELTVYSSLSDTGESEEVLPATYDGDVADIGFNAFYILEFLRAVRTENVRFCFRDAQSAAEFQPATTDTNDKYRYVVMPMRI